MAYFTTASGHYFITHSSRHLKLELRCSYKRFVFGNLKFTVAQFLSNSIEVDSSSLTGKHLLQVSPEIIRYCKDSC
jgi:hypothetical protein